MTGPGFGSWFENWGPPSVKVKIASLSRNENPISDDLTILISNVRPCLTSSGLYLTETFRIIQAREWKTCKCDVGPPAIWGNQITSDIGIPQAPNC